MDALLLVNSPDPSDAVFVPGKLFDYLMARRPMLFVGGPGDAAAIVEEACGPGWVFGYQDDVPLVERLASLARGGRPRDLQPTDAFGPEQTFAPLLGRLGAIPSRS
jgi:hypothetical protein